MKTHNGRYNDQPTILGSALYFARRDYSTRFRWADDPMSLGEAAYRVGLTESALRAAEERTNLLTVEILHKLAKLYHCFAGPLIEARELSRSTWVLHNRPTTLLSAKVGCLLAARWRNLDEGTLARILELLTVE